jgi:hypothetical protein
MPFSLWKLTPLSMYTQSFFLILFSYEDKVDEIEINHNIFSRQLQPENATGLPTKQQV